MRFPPVAVNPASTIADGIAVKRPGDLTLPLVARWVDEVVQRYELEKSELRLLIRPSGTEPVVRVMIEALNGDFVDEFSSRVAIQFS